MIVDIEKVLADPYGVLVQSVAEVVQAAPQSKLPWVVATVVVAVIASAAVWILKPAAPGSVSRFSHLLPEQQLFTGVNSQLVALSPDGSLLVYVANQQLYLRRMDELESNPIPGTDEGPAAPFFSPNGEWIGYWARADAQIKKIAVGGGAPIPLAGSSIPFGKVTWGADDRIVWGNNDGSNRSPAMGGRPRSWIRSLPGPPRSCPVESRSSQ